MTILTKLANRLGFVPKPKEQVQAQRNYAMGQVNRLTADWVAAPSDANREIRPDIRQMRYRSRQLRRDEDYVKNYFRLLKNNVLGAKGIGLEMKIIETAQLGGKTVTQYDTRANQLIEDCWNRQCSAKNCTINGLMTWLDVQNLALESAAGDGAAMFKKHTAGEFGFQLEPIEIDQLDTEWNMPVMNGEIRLGVEYDKAGFVRGYWLFDRHPGSLLYGGVTAAQRRFHEEKEILHLFRSDRPGQATGVPWIHTCAIRAKNLAGYEEAAVIAARIAASKMVFFKRENSMEYKGLDAGDGMQQMECSPGGMEMLPPGVEPVPFDPSHPNENTPAFIKSQLRGMSAGMGVSYVSLANDLEGVNYSSIRAGLLEERENYKAIQEWFIQHFIQPVFEEWLETSLALGKITDGIITLPASKFDKFNKPEWKPRRWDWVDPLKDVQAAVLQIEKGLTSRRQVIAEDGGDIEKVYADQKADKDLAEEYDLDFDALSALDAKGASDKPKGSNGSE